MSLIDSYDAGLFDLDGVVYLGPEVIPGAAESISELRRRNIRVGFVTNNAARTPATVAEHLTELGVEADEADVVASSQAVARLMAAELPAGAPVLVVGTRALAEQVTAVGLAVVNSSADNPAAVVQGYDPNMTWPRLEDAGHAIQHGARWFVSNTDQNRPTNKGLVPGAGPMVDVVRSAVDVEPTIAGKPYPPLMQETVIRLGAERPLFVGDRIDTDIMGAVGVGIDSLFVFTGAHGKQDLLTAGPDGRPTHIGHDLAAMLAPAREATVSEGQAVVGQATARVVNGVVNLDGVPADREGQLDALWAVLQLVWQQEADGQAAVDQLDQVG
ncbi:HAD-IIA family hydrolase [Propionibacteriaceae bacterium Y1923]|uniref:HAD-IIA family hydrolase n=1 Tax=Aestuariimicrobium sp. Y1814 TaxID=3418742 RepID=UPI003C1BB6F3